MNVFSPLTRVEPGADDLGFAPWLSMFMPWLSARPSSSRGGAFGGAVDVIASNALMRDARFVMVFLSSPAVFSTVMV